MSRRRTKSSLARSCREKTSYRTQSAAEARLEWCVANGTARDRLAVYGCGDHWHLGHTARGKR